LNYPKALQPTKWVFEQIILALKEGRGFSLVRLGDGETLTLAHGHLVGLEVLPAWLKNGYAGVYLPDKEIRLRLLEAVRQVNVLGVPTEPWPHFKFLMLRILSNYKINCPPLCHSRLNFHLYTSGLLDKIIQNQKIIVVGRKAKQSLPYFAKRTKSVQSYDLSDIKQLDVVDKKIKANLDFSVALVAAGIPAKILCVSLAKMGKVAIDLGHVLDVIVNPKDNNVLKLTAEWQRDLIKSRSFVKVR